MKKALSILVVLSMVLGLSAFQCASTELTSAKLYIQQKNYDKAKEALEKEIAKNAASDEGFYLLGYLNGEQGDLQSMIKNFDKSLAISKKFEKNIDDYKKFQWQDSFNKGVGFFNKGTKMTDEDSSKVFFNKSVENFENCTIVEPDTVSSYQNMFYSMINAGRSESELEVPLLKIIELKSSPEAYVDLSKVYNNQALILMNSFHDTKNIDDSIKAAAIYSKEIKLLEGAQDLYPDDSKILAQLSNAYVDANKMDVAMKAFQKGVDKDPSNEIYRYNYGVLLLGADDFEGAVAQFQKAIDLKENYVSAYYNLGVTYLKWGAKLQEKAIEEDSGDMTYKEKFGMAVMPLERYLQDNPEDSKIWNFLGKIYANLGQTEKSKEAFEKADLFK
ncbi:MAG: tetratricopeptide repeat protein [Bacteroidetes bacterium]|nr:tetratricopeptide repeat protein [Bacteroidota bacterium]MBU1114528.1 tetratricopeptide repeat protein [Bacteroidota bacterium]MBU1799712.1 tetratricopeptide repeat protein [Bacteroidota bacterium]